MERHRSGGDVSGLALWQMAWGRESRSELDFAGCETDPGWRDSRQSGNGAREARGGARSRLPDRTHHQHAAPRPRTLESNAVAGTLHQRGLAEVAELNPRPSGELYWSD